MSKYKLEVTPIEVLTWPSGSAAHRSHQGRKWGVDGDRDEKREAAAEEVEVDFLKDSEVATTLPLLGLSDGLWR